MTKLVSYSLQGKIATLTLQNGKVNAISPALIEDFNLALDQAEQDNAVIVITGHAGMLSAGYDLNVMKESTDKMKALVKSGSQLTRRLLSFPYPVIVACPGHAIAKGAFLLLASDYRIGVAGKFKIGLNEVAIGMTMHNVGIELARGRLAPVFFNRSVICAEMFNPKDAMTAGFLDIVVEPEAFNATVEGAANMLAQLDMKSHKNTKLKARADLLQTLDEAIELDTHVVLF